MMPLLSAQNMTR